MRSDAPSLPLDQLVGSGLAAHPLRIPASLVDLTMGICIHAPIHDATVQCDLLAAWLDLYGVRVNLWVLWVLWGLASAWSMPIVTIVSR